MSWQASAWAKTQRLGSPAAKSILLCLADYADPEQSACWPTQTQLADDAEVSERTAREWLQRLEDWGLISRERRNRANGARASDRIVLNLEVKVLDGCERISQDEKPACDDAPVSLPANTAGRAYRQSDAEPTGNQTQPTGNGCRYNIEEPPNRTSQGTSQERASARESGENRPEERTESRETLERRFWKIAKGHPQSAGVPKQNWLAEWLRLEPEARDRAERRYPGWLMLLKAQSKDHVPALSTYFRQALFEEVPEPVEEPTKPRIEPPFGKIWGVVRFAELVDGPGPLPAPKSAYVAGLIAQGGEVGERERRAHQARYGFPSVTRMDESAARGAGHVMRPDDLKLEALAATFVPVRVESELWAEWRDTFEGRGWPWLPDPGRQPYVYFPAGGPAALDAVELSLREARETNDGDGRKAAG